MKAMETDSQATIQNQETTINSLKKEKEVCSLELLISNQCEMYSSAKWKFRLVSWSDLSEDERRTLSVIHFALFDETHALVVSYL